MCKASPPHPLVYKPSSRKNAALGLLQNFFLKALIRNFKDRAVAKILLVCVERANWGNINLPIKTFMQNFKLVKNCIKHCIAKFKNFQSVIKYSL